MLWAPNLQLHYPFENQANDYSGYGRHGTVFGGGVFATKPNGGRCLYFDGTGDYVATPSFGLSGTVVVFAAWVRCKKSPSLSQVFLSGPPESVTVGSILPHRTDNSNYLTWGYADGAGARYAIDTTYFAAPYNDNWLHAAVVCDYPGKKTYFFRNGILTLTVSMTGTPVFPSSACVKYVGCYTTLGLLLIDGYLQNVQLWTLATMPAAAHMLANVNRLMLGMNPIW